ncbi:methyltransferase [Cellulomonas sp. 179-A 4D5 NHS]|uniref:methyltransferase n=1 Tax=Cellulomonas sp. 179-A 4D5 NHS TaxID=3142378 RepID=UPI0039A1D579
MRAAGCVFAEDEADLLLTEARTPAELADLVVRRVAGLPLEQVLGWAAFAGLRVVVEPGVFVPRRRSELLVREAVRRLGQGGAGQGGAGQGGAGQGGARRGGAERGGAERGGAEQGGRGHGGAGPDGASGGRPSGARDGGSAGAGGTARPGDEDARRPPVVVDLCCGTGAVGVAVLARVPGAELHAADLDPAAVRCARRNVEPAGGRVHEGDLDAPLPRALLGRVDVLVANAPYVPTDEIAFMPPEAREHEAPVALDGGADGVDVHRRLAAVAPRWLAPHGHLLIETSERQAPLTADAMARAGLVPVVVHDDEVDGTVVVGSRR